MTIQTCDKLFRRNMLIAILSNFRTSINASQLCTLLQVIIVEASNKQALGESRDFQICCLSRVCSCCLAGLSNLLTCDQHPDYSQK